MKRAIAFTLFASAAVGFAQQNKDPVSSVGEGDPSPPGKKPGRCRRGDGGVKSSEDTIAKSLEGDYRPEHLFALRQSLASSCFLHRQICETLKNRERVVSIPINLSTSQDLREIRAASLRCTAVRSVQARSHGPWRQDELEGQLSYFGDDPASTARAVRPFWNIRAVRCGCGLECHVTPTPLRAVLQRAVLQLDNPTARD